MTHGKITSVFIKEYELAKKILGLSKLNKYATKLIKKEFRVSYRVRLLLSALNHVLFQYIP
jgi:hypothetical protein